MCLYFSTDVLIEAVDPDINLKSVVRRSLTVGRVVRATKIICIGMALGHAECHSDRLSIALKSINGNDSVPK